jgi:hypothetical protein
MDMRELELATPTLACVGYSFSSTKLQTASFESMPLNFINYFIAN